MTPSELLIPMKKKKLFKQHTNALRRLSESLKLIGSVMFGAFLKSNYTCRSTVIFGTLKDGTLQINSLASNNNFSYRNVFQNGVNALSKWFLKTWFFVKKLNISCSLDHTILFKFHWHVEQTFERNIWRDFRLLMSALATVARKSFNGKFTAKVDFPIGHFMLPLLMLTLEV